MVIIFAFLDLEQTISFSDKLLVLLLPFIVVIFLHSVEFTRHSWAFSEESQAPLGLPCRWIIKSIIPISFVLLAVAAVARLVRAFAVIGRKNDHGNK